jgi:hypothetical protein
MKEKAKWQPIGKEETHSGRTIAYRPVRPSFVLVLLLVTMAACLGHLLRSYDLLDPFSMFFIIGSWSSIAASATDVNSPLNQTLMDKIRENLDYLYGITASTIFLTGHDTLSDANPRTITISALDYRDRYLSVVGVSFIGSTAAARALAGADDDKIHTQIAARNTPTDVGGYCVWASPVPFMYTHDGGVNASEAPVLTITGTATGGGGAFTHTLWVDSSDSGKLKLTQTGGSSGFRGIAYHFQLSYSADQGQY